MVKEIRNPISMLTNITPEADMPVLRAARRRNGLIPNSIPERIATVYPVNF